MLAGTIHAHPDGVAGLLLARLHPDGTRDTTLDGDGLKVLPVRYGLTVIDLAFQSTGRMVLAQSEDIAIHDPYSRTARIRRFEADGTPDESFAPQLPVEVDEFSGLLVDGQDRIVVHDYSDVLRLLPGGAPDPSFASGGTARQPLQRLRAGLQPGGGLVLAGVRRRGAGRGTAVVRLTASGAVDPGFGVDGVARIPDLAHRDVAFASDGSVLVGGGAYYPAVFDMGVARLDPSGCLDTAFGEDGYATASFDDDGRALEAGALAVQPSGRVVAADQDFVSHGGSPVSFRSYAFALAGWQGAAGPVPGGCGPAPSAASEASWFAPALGWSGGFAGLARRPAR